MPHLHAILSLLLTLALIGCAATTPSASSAPAAEADASSDPLLSTADSAEAVEVPIARTGEPIVVQRTAEPSLIGIARANWPRVVVRPVDPGLTSRPLYFHTPTEQDPRDALISGDVEQRLDRALESSTADSWTQGGGAATVTETGRFFIDVLLLPVNLVRQPPWTQSPTPQGDAQPGRRAAPSAPAPAGS